MGAPAGTRAERSAAGRRSSEILVGLGKWSPGESEPVFDAAGILGAVERVRETAFVLARASDQRRPPQIGVGIGGDMAAAPNALSDYQVMGVLPPLYPEWLGDRSFAETHGVRFPYIAGEMANGIASVELVSAMADADMLGFFGAAGLSLDQVGRVVDTLSRSYGRDRAWGVNVIHAPQEPRAEAALTDLLLRKNVRYISASAFMKLTPTIVQCSASGLRRLPNGLIARDNHIFAKVSRPDVACEFLSPAPAALLDELVTAGKIDRSQAELARQVPVAEDITVEADSGGHTDNRPLSAVLPSILMLRDRLAARMGYQRPIRVGAAGGLGTPTAVAAAFAAGAAYVLTGSVNQVSVESGLSDHGKALLSDAGITDMVMAACADMFELGVNVQVLRRGTLFAGRANRLYEIFRTYSSVQELPAATRATLEREVFRSSLSEVWASTRQFWMERDAAQVTRAETDPKHQMALMFRWYLGKSSRWAIVGDTDRATDYQIWCGPALGAFNEWVSGSFLADPANRSVVQIARNLLEGAAIVTRAQQLRCFGVPVPSTAFAYQPRHLS